MRLRNFYWLLVSAITLLLQAAADAAPFLPTSVTPGSPYQLMFVTRDGRDAASASIADYNAFVNVQAALNPTLTGTNVGVTYFAVGSTSAIDARANAIVTAPVYNFNDQKIADSFADIWDGTLDAPVAFDQFIAGGFPDMFTGSDSAGFAISGSELGTASPRSGLSNFASFRWVDDSVAPQASPYAFYALSEPIIAPPATAVPEPTTLLIWSLLATLGITLGWRRPRR